HRHPRAQLDVHQLVHDETRGHRNEIERRAALVEKTRGSRTGDTGAVLLKRRAGPLLAREHQGRFGDPSGVERAPGHRLDLGTHLAVTPLDAPTEEPELEQLAGHDATWNRPWRRAVGEQSGWRREHPRGESRFCPPRR